MNVIVLGAGMAGLSAAKSLQNAGHVVTVLEAKDRIGGRTYTNRSFSEHPVEYGAEFIHGSKAATWPLIKELGLETLHWTKTTDSLVHLEDGSWASMEQARQERPDFDITRSWRLPKVDALPNEDWRSYLSRIGFDEKQLRYVRRSFANACGESMRFLSAQAMLELIYDKGGQSGEGDYRLMSGYDALVNHLAEHLDIRLNDPVISVKRKPSNTKPIIETLDGEIFEANAVVITIPLGVLQSGSISFEPDLSSSKKQALLGIRMGPVIKLIYNFANPIVDEKIMAIYSSQNPPMWWSPSFGHQTNQNIWTAFVSGDWAMDLLAKGEEGALYAALESLKTELNLSELKPLEMHLENWPDDPYTRGGYSYVLPGHDGAREQLAKKTPPLFWAGEATEPENRAATVHGAYLSGQRAAQEVIDFLSQDT